MAQAYEQGDGKTVGKVMGEQVTNILAILPSGGFVGIVKITNILKTPEEIFSIRQVVTEGVTSRKVVIQSVPSGTSQMALDDFNAMGVKNVRVISTDKGEVRIGSLPDGTTIKLRPSNDGGLNRPTIEIVGSNGRKIKEVRYGNKT
ncbi:hypothetical protein [Azospira oryzae]|uniref:hypothetical protein n=1 Tax=Azospira oryzae TaxID=146939 RepID=UPI001962BBE6|nr:hypothetical protein [Azospira oryzae]